MRLSIPLKRLKYRLQKLPGEASFAPRAVLRRPGEDELAAAVARDKKAEASKGSGSKTVNYVLPVRIGKVVISALSLPS